jgi:predicted metal-dependent enzyme (double-stranded beta helix superfamily)
MTSDRYTLAQFIEDLREVVKQTADERTILKLVRPLVKRLAQDKSWVTSTLYQATPEQGFGYICFMRKAIIHWRCLR